jgi:hypothetical protein
MAHTWFSLEAFDEDKLPKEGLNKNQITIKADKNNTAQYYVYDYQGKRVRTVVESNNQVQSQRDYLNIGITN